MSIFGTSKKKILKKRQALCSEAEVFTQVHYVREHNSTKNKFNTLPLKDDPDRAACLEWYEKHGNPTTFSAITQAYLKESKLDSKTICEKYALDSDYFKKLENNPTYHPGKGEAISLSMAFRLNFQEAKLYLKSADHPMTNSNKADLIVRFFLDKNEYNITDLNYVLKHFELPTLKDMQ
jgi:hypothetical protein